MSVVESETVDGVAVNENQLKLLISDHLDFNDEYNHLLCLQNKINSYLGFIENRQYCEIYPDYKVDSVVIEIHFKYNITDNCKKFITVVNNQISEMSVVCIAVESR
ncbi:MAG: hypothetical protein K2L70_00520 [Clostridia bacterium]|nr:hypothetical protein [Clostridia bacterium]